MMQPYTLGFNTTVIDGGNIATETIRAWSLYSGSVDAWKINTEHLAAKSITAALLAVGPQYQFRCTNGGASMVLNQDGSLSLPSEGNNPSDRRWVADNSRSYSATQPVKTFAATFSGGGSRGIVFNLTDPFATTGQRGILVWLDGGVSLFTVSGVGVYGSLGNYNPGFNTTSGPVRLVIQHYGNQSTPRMRVFVNGTEINPGGFTDAFLGSTSNGQQGGCAGFLLSDSSIKVSEIVMGNQTVIIEDGRVQAQHVDAASIGASQLIISNIVGGINAGSTTINGSKITTNTITADLINVASINTSSAWIGALDARVIKARTIKASMIEARAYNFINNFSVTGTTTDWSPAGTIETVARGAVNVRAMKIAPVDSVQVLSSIFEIDPTKSYQTKLSFLVGTEAVGGRVYFGLYAYAKDGTIVPLEYLTNSGTWATLGTNCYWFYRNNPCDGSWHDLTGFLMAHDTQPQDAPPPPIAGQLNPYVAVNGVLVNAHQDRSPILRMPPNAVSMQIRFLNYHNSGVSRSVWFANPSVSEVGTGVINADNIRAGALESYGNGTNGRYQSYNYSANTAVGFKLSHAPFTATNKWNRPMSVQAEFGSNILVKGYPLGPALGVALTGFDIPPLDQLTPSSVIFYRGNNNPADALKGAPKIADDGGNPATNPRLLINSHQIINSGGASGSLTGTVLHFQIQPRTNQDNLDAVSHIDVLFWKRYSSTLSLDSSAWIPVSSRRYKVTGTPGDAGNAGRGTFVFLGHNSSTAFAPQGVSSATNQLYIQAKICNVYGDSAQHWFAPPDATGTGDTASTGRWTDIGTSPPSGTSGGTTGTLPDLGDGGGGGGCVPAGTPFLTPQGWVPVETITEGSLAVGYDENTLEAIVTPITKVFRYPARRLVRVVTECGSLVCSHDHRLALLDQTGKATYPAVRDLSHGDRVLYRDARGRLAPTHVVRVENLGITAPVYHCTLAAGHVYVAGNFPAHNTIKIPNDPYNP